MELKNFENEMTNEEPTFIESKQEPFYFGLPYHRTDWGASYEVYKEMSQNALQKGLLKHKNYQKKIKNSKLYENGKILSRKEYVMTRFLKEIFYNTAYNEEENKWETPCALSDNKNESYAKFLVDTDKIFTEWYRRTKKEYEEVEQYYKTKKKELVLKQTVDRNTKSKQFVECPCCKSSVTRTNLSRHKKSIKCLKIE